MEIYSIPVVVNSFFLCQSY